MLSSLTAITYLDRICISIVGVRIKTDLHLSNEQFGWVLGSFALAYALFEIPSGALGDHIGPRKVFIRIVLFWSLFTALTGVVTGLISLLIVRFLFGIGESGTFPNSVITISRWFPANETARACSWMAIGLSLGSAIAPLIIIPLASSYGWRMPFFANGAIGVVWVSICFLWFRNFPSEMKHISESEKTMIEANRRYNKEQYGINIKFILRNPTLKALMLMYFCNQWAIYFFVAWMPVYLQEGRHFSENETKPIIFTLFIAGIIGYATGGIVSDWLVKKKGLRFGRRIVAMTGLGICSILFLLTGLPIQNHIAALCLIAANGSYAFGSSVCFPTCTDIGRNNAGTVSGAMNFCGQIGAFCMAIVVGKIVGVTHNFSYALFLLASVIFCGCFLWLAIDPTKQIAIDNEK